MRHLEVGNSIILCVVGLHLIVALCAVAGKHMTGVECATARDAIGEISRSFHLLVVLVEGHCLVAYLACCVIHDVREAVQGTRCVGTHLCSLTVGDGSRMGGDGGRILTEDESILHTSRHIGRHISRMTIVEEPRSDTLAALVVEHLLVGYAYRTDGDTHLTGHVQVVIIEFLVEGGEVRPVAAVCPVHRHDNDGIGVRTVFADIIHPLFDIAAELLDIGTRQTALLLEDDVRPCLCAYEHLRTRITVFGQSVALVPVGFQRLTQ